VGARSVDEDPESERCVGAWEMAAHRRRIHLGSGALAISISDCQEPAAWTLSRNGRFFEQFPVDFERLHEFLQTGHTGVETGVRYKVTSCESNRPPTTTRPGGRRP
jgi:hypothetical protein